MLCKHLISGFSRQLSFQNEHEVALQAKTEEVAFTSVNELLRVMQIPHLLAVNCEEHHVLEVLVTNREVMGQQLRQHNDGLPRCLSALIHDAVHELNRCLAIPLLSKLRPQEWHREVREDKSSNNYVRGTLMLHVEEVNRDDGRLGVEVANLDVHYLAISKDLEPSRFTVELLRYKPGEGNTLVLAESHGAIVGNGLALKRQQHVIRPQKLGHSGSRRNSGDEDTLLLCLHAQ
mmetsp:Transcript_107607/g.186781  ORF Transcript_107607/g.186781 Transcript_107607/m.186781 type:complete len:233 (+) Transcript_107607:97-795(+)